MVTARWVDATTGEAEAEVPSGVTYTGVSAPGGVVRDAGLIGSDRMLRRSHETVGMVHATPAARLGWRLRKSAAAMRPRPPATMNSQFKFTAKPSKAGLPNATVTVASTKARLLGLSPQTDYTVSKGLTVLVLRSRACITAGGVGWCTAWSC